MNFYNKNIFIVMRIRARYKSKRSGANLFLFGVGPDANSLRIFTS